MKPTTTIDVRVSKEGENNTTLSTPPKKSSENITVIISGIIFAIILAVSIFFQVENLRLSNDIKNAQKSGMEYDASIEKLKADKTVMAAEIIDQTKATLQQSIQDSEAQKYISEIMSIAQKYKISFVGFAYNNGKIATAATSDTTTPGEDAVKKISEFVQYYRTNPTALFRLEPIVNVSGQEQHRTFPVEFSVNGTLTK